MPRITIEFDDSGSKSGTGQGTGAGTGATQPQVASSPAPQDVSGVPTELAARAATIGAHNGGAAPALGGTLNTAAPVPFISSGASSSAQSGSSSAGAAPAHLSGSSEND